MTNKMLDAALVYAERGWAIFPVRTDKKPYTSNGVNDATTDPKVIRKMWAQWPNANIALNVGAAGMMVTDLDPGHEMKVLEENVGPIPDTPLQAHTPRGGRHLYHLLENNELVAMSTERLAPHVDVRSFHSYVLLPPSKTKDGVYTWGDDADDGKATPAFRTNEMVRIANIRTEKHRDHDTWLIDADLEENIELCTKWLLGEGKLPCKIAIQGRGGDQTTYETAAMCKSYGISQVMAFDLMWDHWNERCIPAWDVEELEVKIANGYKYNTSPPGHMTPAYQTMKSSTAFSKVEVEPELKGNEWRRGHFRGVDRARMDLIKPPLWLIDDFLPEGGYALMFGAPGTYKTFLALDIALSIAVGFPLNPVWEAIQMGPVCFVLGEGRAQLLKRVRAWEREHYGGNIVENFKLVDPVPNIAQDPELFLALLDDLSDDDGFKLVVLDTVGRAMQGVNENAQEHASSFTKLVERIQGETDATVLALHHIGKKDKHTARGSSVFGADVDTELRTESNNMLVQMTMLKQREAEKWSYPRVIKLREIQLTPEQKSLVAIPTEEEYEDQESMDLLDRIEDVGLAWLKARPDVSFSQRGFAEDIALDDFVTVGSDRVRKYLTTLREEKSRRIARCWVVDGNKREWRWQI